MHVIIIIIVILYLNVGVLRRSLGAKALSGVQGRSLGEWGTESGKILAESWHKRYFIFKQ